MIIFLLFLTISVASWGLAKGPKRAFRPAMSLASGELSGLKGSTLMMTATATPRTMRVLQSQFPEIVKWTNLLSPPLRKNVTLLVPPPDIINSKVEVALAPFVEDMKNNKKPYLILVRGKQAFFKNSSNHFVAIFIGINKGTAIYLSILKSLNDPCEEGRSVGFYHRNTSLARKQEILEDLKLPITSQEKKLLCVVATVSLGRILYKT